MGRSRAGLLNTLLLGRASTPDALIRQGTQQGTLGHLLHSFTGRPGWNHVGPVDTVGHGKSFSMRQSLHGTMFARDGARVWYKASHVHLTKDGLYPCQYVI